MTPYATGKDWTLYAGECADVMRDAIADESIDLVVTSPPYDGSRAYTPEFDPGALNWHTIIDELYRVTKPGGVVVWVVADQTTDGSESATSFRQALYAMERGFNLHDTMFYQTNKPPLSHNRYEQCIEYMFIWSKGRPITFNPIREPSIYFGVDKRRNGYYTHRGGYVEDKSIRNGKRRAPPKPMKTRSHLWYYKTGAGHSGDDVAFDHPATFPEALAHDHIISWSNPGDIVLDCFVGSGTTVKMALMTGRQAIGIDVSPEYLEIAKKRIALTRLPLFEQVEEELEPEQMPLAL